jgi:outer membrane receptor for ferric coprogen and ferric-rhodotorulic acid
VSFHPAFLRGFSLSLLAAGTLLGEIPPAATAGNTAAKSPLATRPLTTLTDDVLELSPFTVKASSEEGWNASSTLLGNRINQDLVKVPVTVDVLTKDFLNDVGVFNMDDAAAFVSGVTVVPRLEARNDDGRLTFRGLTGSADTSRNFFKWSVPSDTYNVERFDFGKGSNSMMFGDSTPGGQVTTTTKRARFAHSGELLVVRDSRDSYRAQLDLNRRITSNLAVRLNFVNRTDNSYVHGSFQTFRAGDIAFAYRPFAHTLISVEAERGQYIRRRADNTAAILPVAAAGRGFSTNNRWYVTSDGEVIQRPSAVSYTHLTLPTN